MEYTEKTDIFSLGVVFYQMLFGRMPWPAKSPDELLEKMIKNQIDFSGRKLLQETINIL